MRGDSAEVLFQSFLREAIVSKLGVGRNVQSFVREAIVSKLGVGRNVQSFASHIVTYFTDIHMKKSCHAEC